MTTTELSLERDDARGREESDRSPVTTDPGLVREDGATASAAVRARTETTETADGWLWKPAAGLGVLSLFGAMAVVLLPGTVVQPLEFTNEAVRSMRSFALLLGAFVGIFGLYVAYHRETGDDGTDGATADVELPAANPEESHGPANDTVGDRLDQHLDRIGGMVEAEYGNQYTAYKVRQNLEALAVTVVAEAADCSRERAREHVESGTWTDDVRAAAFVGGPEAPERTLAMRIRDWANGSTFDRQVRATVDELAELDEGETT